VRQFWAAFRLQVHTVRTDPDYFMPLVTVPMFTITFLAIVRHAGREDLTEYALMAPVLIALWALSLMDSGEIVDGDRQLGVLEPLVAAPANFALVVCARVLAVTMIALFAFVEVAIAGWLAFRVSFDVHHPAVFAATLVATALAMSGTAVIMAALFVLARSTRTFQNSLSFPFYVLGGVLVPVSLLPGWVQPLSTGVFLSWSADLLRDSLDPAPVERLAVRVGMILALGLVGFVVGQVMLRRILTRLRERGELALM
jgi:ABC-2 type transport system permease protein